MFPAFCFCSGGRAKEELGAGGGHRKRILPSQKGGSDTVTVPITHLDRVTAAVPFTQLDRVTAAVAFTQLDRITFKAALKMHLFPTGY